MRSKWFRKCAAIMAMARLSFSSRYTPSVNKSIDPIKTRSDFRCHRASHNSPSRFNSRSCIRKKSFTSSDTTGEVLVPAVPAVNSSVSPPCSFQCADGIRRVSQANKSSDRLIIIAPTFNLYYEQDELLYRHVCSRDEDSDGCCFFQRRRLSPSRSNELLSVYSREDFD